MWQGTSLEKNIENTENNTLKDMINHFVERIINGNPPHNSALIGALTVVVLESIMESIKKGGETIRIRV